jgi:hypothetical protein
LLQDVDGLETRIRSEIGVYLSDTTDREKSAANLIWAALEYNKYEAQR